MTIRVRNGSNADIVTWRLCRHCGAMTNKHVPSPLASLAGSRLVEVEVETGWWFRFEPTFTLHVECNWRLTDQERILVTNEDNGQVFGLPSPVNASEGVAHAVGNGRVTEIELRGVAMDLLVRFENGTTLEILPNSSGYENWHFFAGDGQEGRVLGGGKLQA